VERRENFVVSGPPQVSGGRHAMRSVLDGLGRRTTGGARVAGSCVTTCTHGLVQGTCFGGQARLTLHKGGCLKDWPCWEAWGSTIWASYNKAGEEMEVLFTLAGGNVTNGGSVLVTSKPAVSKVGGDLSRDAMGRRRRPNRPAGCIHKSVDRWMLNLRS